MTVLDLLRPSVVAQCRRRQSGTGLTKRHWLRYGRTIELLPLRSVPTRLSANPVSQSERGLAGGNGQLTPVWGGLFAAMGMAAWPRTIVRRRFCTLSAHSLPKSDGPLRSWQRRPRMRAPVRRRGTCARPSLACEQCLANSTRRRQPHWNRTHSLCTMLSCSRLVWYEFGFAHHTLYTPSRMQTINQTRAQRRSCWQRAPNAMANAESRMRRGGFFAPSVMRGLAQPSASRQHMASLRLRTHI